MVYQVFLTGRNNINYEFITFNDISINKQTPVSPMPLPEEDSDENVLIKVEGNTTTMDITWTILNASSPVGSGAIIWDSSLGKWKSTSPKESSPDEPLWSTFQQIQELESEFAPKSISDFFKVRIFDTEASSSDKTGGIAKYIKDGLLQGFTFRTDSSSPVNWIGNMQFIEGSVVTSLSSNTHESPTITGTPVFIGSNRGSATGIEIDFKEFLNYGSGDRPVTTGAILRYKPVGSVAFWREKEISFSANTSAPYNYTNKQFVLTDLDNTQDSNGDYLDYTIRLSLLTLGGRGQWEGKDPEIVVSDV